jgi:glycosyltransferase involved in cell wall biosynthesis
MPRRPEPDRAPAQGRERPLSLIIINDFAASIGGTDRVAVTEAAGLAGRGHQVTLVVGDGTPDPELAQAGVKVRSTGQSATLRDPNRLRAATQGIWNRRAAGLVRELTGSADPRSTVVHVHGITKVLSASVVRAAVDSGLVTLATLHDYFAACPNGGFFNYQRNQVCTLTPLSAQCIGTHCDARAYSHKAWRVGRSAVQRRFGAMPAGVREFILPSRGAAQILRPFLPPDAPVHVVPNPVLGSRLPRADVARNTAFVLVGRLQRDKGGVLFAEAAAKANVPAVLVGDGEEADRIRRANPEVELTGRLDPDRLRPVVRGARALVNASLLYETQGLTSLEAASHGVPAIVSDVSVGRDAVLDGVTGLWFGAGDSDDLAEKLLRLATDPELAAGLGVAAYDRFWSAPPDVSSHLDRLEGVYRAALARGT